MKKLGYVVLAMACVGAVAASTTTTFGTSRASGSGVSSDVQHMLNDISSANIEHSIRTLAAFATRTSRTGRT